MNAAPRTVLKNFHFVRRWLICQVFAIISQFRKAIGFNVVERVRERHVTAAMVMPIAFRHPLRCGRGEETTGPRGTSYSQPVGERLSTVEQSFKCHEPVKWNHRKRKGS